MDELANAAGEPPDRGPLFAELADLVDECVAIEQEAVALLT